MSKAATNAALRSAQQLADRAHEDGDFRPVGVTVIVNNLNHVLLVQSAKDRSYWGFPQGGVRPAEAIVTGAKREAWEETRISRRDMKLVAYLGYADLDAEPNRRDRRSFSRGKRYFFLAFSVNGGDRPLSLRRSELSGYRWASLNDVPKLTGTTRPAKRTLLLQALKEYIELVGATGDASS